MKHTVFRRYRGASPVPGGSRPPRNRTAARLEGGRSGDPVDSVWCEWRFVGRSIVSVAPWVLPIMLVALVLMLLSGCGQAVGGGFGRGSSSLSIVVAEPAGVGTQATQESQPELVPAFYLFSGTGPGGESFSMTASGDSVTVPGLVAGRWTIRVEALNAEEVVILAGQSTVDVEPAGAVSLNLSLEPLEGHGSLLVYAVWNAEHTINPSATVSVTGADGETALHQLTLVTDTEGDGGGSGSSANGLGAAQVTLEDLPTGLYRLTVRLYDDGYRVMGSAAAVRVVHGIQARLRTEFQDINKVGLPIDITAENFAIAWDAPEEHAPSHYRVYNRTRGEHDWSLMAEIAAQPQPQFTITREQLPYGTYELAVSSVLNGTESPLHSSMADDAQPGSGWYIRWLGPQ